MYLSFHCNCVWPARLNKCYTQWRCCLPFARSKQCKHNKLATRLTTLTLQNVSFFSDISSFCKLHSICGDNLQKFVIGKIDPLDDTLQKLVLRGTFLGIFRDEQNRRWKESTALFCLIGGNYSLIHGLQSGLIRETKKGGFHCTI